MSIGRVIATLMIVVIFAGGGFAIMNWWQKPRVAAGNGSYSTSSAPQVINRLEGCEGFNQSIDEAITLQNRIGHPHNSERLATLRRDCRGEQQEHYRAVTR